MRYHNITKADMLNGEGLRVVLWTSGCSHHCPACHNVITWNCNDGLEFDEAAKKAPSSYWLYDGVHPDTAGHELIKREWLKAFREYVG